MQTSEIANQPFQTKEEKEQLFQALENDEQLFKETLEVMLTMVVSDPKLTLDVVDLIESDYRNLYSVIMGKITTEASNTSALGCCKDILKH